MLLVQRFHFAEIIALLTLGNVDYSVANTTANTTTDGPREESVVSNAELASQLGRMERQMYQLQDQVNTLQLDAESIWQQFFLTQAQKHKKLADLYTQLATQQAQMVDAMDNMVETVRSFKTTSAKAKDLQEKMEQALCHATPPLGHIFHLAPPHGQLQYSMEEADRACKEHGGWLAEYSKLLKLDRLESQTTVSHSVQCKHMNVPEAIHAWPLKLCMWPWVSKAIPYTVCYMQSQLTSFIYMYMYGTCM
ncbi:Hypp6450 [Branchiostoma lanceolatum]|uniref:Hypp6450 protein n=1 Tax=Branchiostoma lanceolatum TaxID=7740 RepID=A0A8K0E4C4_BRALA|nr:Hypp6450 [Branchiostoma lanceolatum]